MSKTITRTQLLADSERLDLVEACADQIKDAYEMLMKDIGTLLAERSKGASDESIANIREFASREGAYYKSILNLSERIQRAVDFEREKAELAAEAPAA